MPHDAPSQPATWGPILGGAVGGIAGGGAGAWFIRHVREENTRVAGAITGGALGLGIGLSLFARTEDVYWRLPGLLILPAMGAVVGDKLAVTFMGKSKRESSSVALHTVQPSVVPLVGRGSTGLSVGVSGSFF